MKLSARLLVSKKKGQKEKENVEKKDLASAPNIITIVRFFSSSIFWIALVIDINQLWLGILFLVGAVSDKVDGFLARKTKTVSTMGKNVLEPMADATFIISAAVYLVIKGDLPVVVIEIGFGMVIIGLIAQLILFGIRRKWYAKKMVSMKLAVGAAYIILVMYFFKIPTRDLIVWMGLGLGIVTLYEYLKNIVIFGLKRK